MKASELTSKESTMGMNMASGAPTSRQTDSPHTFHLPVMGTGFTIDTPIRIARYGISSVISIGDDMLIETMREFHCRISGRAYRPIKKQAHDSRARRITAYLNLVNELVKERIGILKSSPFEPGSEITRYFEMLPHCPLKHLYKNMLGTADVAKRYRLQSVLRNSVVPGSIDVNIMTKLDRDNYHRGKKQSPEFAIAMSALRGYASSTLRSSLVLSAGINRRLFTYMTKFDDFFSESGEVPKKKIIVKVSDYRSALVQGKLLARMGLWVSEYRIESGLNCGGHAFATKGELLGPILEMFGHNRESLARELYRDYQAALSTLGRECRQQPSLRITVQGGIGTCLEHSFLYKHYGVDSAGWATPFLLVPEATNVDFVHLKKLMAATSDDVSLSENSPLGIPFWNLNTSGSEEVRLKRIREGKPGSPCQKGYLGFNTEFTDVPICRASRRYQESKKQQLAVSDLPSDRKQMEVDGVLSKACICLDLAGGPLMKNGLSSNESTSVCCGPNIVNFNKIATLDQMIDHIYGRRSLTPRNGRPHMFVVELRLYIDHLRREMLQSSMGLLSRTTQFFREYRENLRHGIIYYRRLAAELDPSERRPFLLAMDDLSNELDSVANDLHPVKLGPSVRHHTTRPSVKAGHHTTAASADTKLP